MEPLAGTPAPQPAAAPASQPNVTSPPPAPAPAPAPASGSVPGAAGGAAPAAGAGAPFAGVAAPAPAGGNGQGTPAAPANPYASLPAEVQQHIAALQHRAQQFDRYQHLIPLGYRAYQQAGQPAQPAATQVAAPQTNVFGLPAQFDFNLLNHVSRDPVTGQLVNGPGAPPDAAIQVQRYQEQLHKAQREFWQNPEQFLGDLIEKRAAKAAEQLYQQRFQGHQESQAANAILEQNSGWLFEAGADGRPVTRFDPASGQMKPVLSQYGQMYAQEVQRLVGMGVTNPQAQHQYALASVQNRVYQEQLRQQQAPQQGQQQAQQFVTQAAAAPPGVVHPPAPAVTPPDQPQGFSLRDRMAQLMQGAGITEQVFQQQFRGAA